MARLLLCLGLALVLSCKKSPPTAREIFEGELNRRGVAFSNPQPDTYELAVGETQITANLENVAKAYERDRDRLAVVRFVDQVLATPSPGDVPPWESVRRALLWQVQPSEADSKDMVRDGVTSKLSRAVVIASPDAGTLTWVSPQMVADWKVTEATVRQVATANLSALLVAYPLETTELAGTRLGMVPLPGVFNALKASVFLAPNFRDYVAPSLGWPVYVVVPCRDFIYVVPSKDREFLSRLGSTVVREYRESGYALTTEVLLVSDAGVEAFGAFPE